MSTTVGVLAVQGDVRENVLAAEAAMAEAGMGGRVSAVRGPQQIPGLGGLIIPGGESTTIGGMLESDGSMAAVREAVGSGMPVLGICAGMILLSGGAADRTVGRTGQPLIGGLDVRVERNSFGRQPLSFEADLSMEAIGIPRFRGVFIRAPSVSEAGPGVEVLARLGDSAVAVRQGNIIGTSFHPELTRDTSLHRHFLGLIKE